MKSDLNYFYSNHRPSLHCELLMEYENVLRNYFVWRKSAFCHSIDNQSNHKLCYSHTPFDKQSRSCVAGVIYLHLSIVYMYFASNELRIIIMSIISNERRSRFYYLSSSLLLRLAVCLFFFTGHHRGKLQTLWAIKAHRAFHFPHFTRTSRFSPSILPDGPQPERNNPRLSQHMTIIRNCIVVRAVTSDSQLLSGCCTFRFVIDIRNTSKKIFGL